MKQSSTSAGSPWFPLPLAARAFIVLIAFLAATAPATAGESLQFGGNVTLANDYVYRGVSQTTGSPALQAGLELTHESNFFASLWASNVDFVADGDPDDGAEVEVDFTLGYSQSLSERISAEISWFHYAFPGTRPTFHYDYGEWIASLTLDGDHSVSFGYARSVFGSHVPARYYGLSSSYDLPRNLSLQLEAGYFDLRSAYGESYSHGAIALSKDIDPFSVELSYQFTSDSARALFRESNVGPRWVFAVGVSF